MSTWQAAGIEIGVSVNIAAQHIQHPEFVSMLKDLLDEFADVPAKRLELEITESTVLYDIGRVSRTMKEYTELGVQFALDNFGTGYSSLTYLKSLPATVLKIDRSFVRDLLDDREDLAITEGIMALARAFRRTPVAEGVETVQQGYCIARPMAARDLPSWIENFQIAPEWKLAAAACRSGVECSPK